MKPNIRGRHFSPLANFDVTVQTNTKGLRDREFYYHKPQNTIRILGIGDSFTFGWGVENHESCLKVLENMLNAAENKTNHKFEALNAGVGGYGTAQQLRYLTKELYKYSPDWIILQISSGDISDSMIYDSYILDEGELNENIPQVKEIASLSRLSRKIPFYEFWVDKL